MRYSQKWPILRDNGKRMMASQCIVALLFSIYLLFAVTPARCQSYGDYNTYTENSHQLFVQAGPYSKINTATGRLITTIPICKWQVPGGQQIDLTLSHVTCDNTYWGGRPASGWRHSYNSWIAGGAEWNLANTCFRWEPVTHDRRPGNPHEISELSDGYEVNTKDQIKYSFKQRIPGTNVYWYLTKAQDTRGNSVYIDYTEPTCVLAVTKIRDASGRQLTLSWDYNSSMGRVRLISITDPKGRSYNLTYNASAWLQLEKIEYPAHEAGASRPYVRFSYSSVPYPSTDRIQTVSIRNNDGDGELTWTYTYDTLRPSMVVRVDGPPAGNGQPTKVAVDYNIDTETIDGVAYCKRVIKDALYDTTKSAYHRVVHLYNYEFADPVYGEFGPVIHYEIGSKSTNDTGGSTYDGLNSYYPSCPYSRYVWDLVDDGHYDGTLKTFTNPQGKTWIYKCYSDSSSDTDNRLNLWKVTDPLGKVVANEYNTQNRLTKTTDQENRVTTNEYYATTYDLWKTHVNPTGVNLTTTYEYDTYGNQKKVTDPYGHCIQTDYDATYHCYPIKQTDLQTHVFSEWGGYDAFGNSGWSKAPRLSSCPTDKILTTSYTYDNLDRLKQTTNPDGTHSHVSYDANGNATECEDANGEIVSFDYDNFGNVIEETSYAQLNGSTSDTAVTIALRYNEIGLLEWVRWKRDSSQKEIAYTYDERGRLIKENFPGTKPDLVFYYYDVNGRVRQRSEDHDASSPRDRTLDFTFDELGRPDQDKQGTTVLVDRDYYYNGLIKKVTGPDGYIEYAYDNANRLETCYQSYVDKTLHYIYSKSPHTLRTYIREGNGKTGAIQGSYFSEYASDGSLYYLTSPPGDAGGPKTEHVYDTAVHGLLSRVNYNILTPAPHTEFAYDNTVKKRLWLSDLANYRSDDSLVSSFTYQHDNVGNRIVMTEANGDHTDYVYDASYRLRTEERKDPFNSRIYKYEYQYDEIGNRKAKVLTNSAPGSPKTYTYSYGDNNLLNSVSGAASGTFGYDYYGNQSTRSIGGASWSYTYDALNHMTGATLSGTTTGFKYDALGKRIEKDIAGTKTRYIYDGGSMIAEADGSNLITAWYTPGICESRYIGGAWQTFYYQTDGLGSTRELTDTLQRVTDAYAYNAWGENLGQLRASDDPNKTTNPLRYVGKSGYYSDDNTGLDLLGARYYDPLIGRFITQDPSRDGLNWYAYAGNNPVNAVDPTGQTREEAIKTLKDWDFAINDVADAVGIQSELLGAVVYNEMYAGGKPQSINETCSVLKFIAGQEASLGITQVKQDPAKIPGCDTVAGRIDYLYKYDESGYAGYFDLCLGAAKLRHLSKRRYSDHWGKLSDSEMSIVLTEYNQGESPNGIVNKVKPRPSQYGQQGKKALPKVREILDAERKK